MFTWEEIQESLTFGSTTIATGYYSKSEQYLKAAYGLIPISLTVPKWFHTGCSFKRLAPTGNILYRYKNKQINENEYIEWYYSDVLFDLEPRPLIRQLKYLVRSSKIILLCYEKPFDFCHRYIVSHWFSKAGIKVSEFGNPSKQDKVS